MAYTTVNKSTDHFNVKLYTGNGSSGHSITGVGFQPDLVWIKNRQQSYSHFLTDAVRGVTKEIYSNANGAEYTRSNGLTAFGADGFTVGDNNGHNQNGNNLVAWNWKAGNSSGSSNSDGSVTSTVSANTTAGFSICKFDFPSSGNFTFGHGLGVAPKMFMLKGYTATANWQVFHGGLGNTYNTQLNVDSASNTAANWWGSTSPTSTVCTVGSDLIETGQTAIAYCFAEKPGFSSFGSYTANNSSDGPFLFTGMKPAYVVTKCTSASSHWNCFDNKRSLFNDRDDYHKLNEATSEDTGSSDIQVDFLSNGFKIRGNNNEINGSSRSYIYFAFAEAPLVGSNNVPCTAR